MSRICTRYIGLMVGVMLVLSPSAMADNRLQLGELFLERPTLENLGLRWYMAEGSDANRNATATVQYREVGSSTWRDGYDLLRGDGEVVQLTSPFVVPNHFAGSVLNLKPATSYEVKVTLTDPNGILNSSGTNLGTSYSITQAMTTRAVPKPATTGSSLHVYPPGWSGPKLAGSYTSLSDAYAAAQPGDQILMHAGTYTGTYTLNKTNATAQAPIAIRSAGDGEVILDGSSGNVVISVQKDANHHYIEGLTITRSGGGTAIRVHGATGVSVVHNTIKNTSFGLIATDNTNRDLYIADNTFIGPETTWARDDAENDSRGIWLRGQGHVVAHNSVTDYWDGVALNGDPPSDKSLQNAAIDIYGNHIARTQDNGAEIDYGVSNIRLYRNRVNDSFNPISVQPVFGGPAYVFRNEVFNATRGPLKFGNEPSGVLVFNNTFISKRGEMGMTAGWSNSQFFNNLWYGESGTDRAVIWTGTATPNFSELDYNGYQYIVSANGLVIWWKKADGDEQSFQDTQSKSAFERFIDAFGYEENGWISNNLPDNFMLWIPPPGEGNETLAYDLRLLANAMAIDSGKFLANFTDDYTGTAPDMGAYEFGDEVYLFGPRHVPEPGAASVLLLAAGALGLRRRV